MWIFRWVISAIIILMILGFALQNQEQTVSVRIVQWESPHLPLYLLLYMAFGIGILLWVLVSAWNTFKLKGEIYRLQRENRRIKEDLNRLRNASIEEEGELTELDQSEGEKSDE
jgi:uncharacterized integral membrane protein